MEEDVPIHEMGDTVTDVLIYMDEHPVRFNEKTAEKLARLAIKNKKN